MFGQVKYKDVLMPIRTGGGNKLYFTNSKAEWNYTNRYLWACDILERADAGERFDVPVGHDAFIESVHEQFEYWSVELIGEVYIH